MSYFYREMTYVIYFHMSNKMNYTLRKMFFAALKIPILKLQKSLRYSGIFLSRSSSFS